MDHDGSAIVSGEGVALDLRTAGVSSRALAAALDFAIQLGLLLVLVLITLATTSGSDVAAQRAVAVVESVVVLAGYPIVMEWLCRGRTIGKMTVGLRVVRDDGGPIGFRHALVRGLAGMILDKPGILVPFSTFASMATISANRSEKRIGDLMAGTVVLNERAAPQPLATPPPWVQPALRPWVLSLDLHRLDDRLALAVRQFVSRAYAMSPGGQAALGEDLRARVLDVVSPPPPPGVPTSTLLQSVLAERRRRAGEPVAGAVQPGWQRYGTGVGRHVDPPLPAGGPAVAPWRGAAPDGRPVGTPTYAPRPRPGHAPTPPPADESFTPPS